MGADILNEDMGVRLDFSNMELLSYDTDNRVLHNAEEASVISFRSALGAEHNMNDDQMDAEVPGAGPAAIAHEGAMDGADSA
jgi:hypothetical protein